MKKILCLALCLIFTLSFAAAEGATLTVAGTASVTLTPDFATINLGVSTQAKTVAEAQTENAARMNALLDALTAQGIADVDIQTTYFNVHPLSEYRSNIAEITGYQVSNQLSVTVRDLNSISTVLDAAISAGANESYGLTFDSTKRNEAYDQAVALAAKEAVRKAEVLAAASGVKLGSLLTVSENNMGYAGDNGIRMKLEDTAAGTLILQGELAVSATVTMAYLAE